MKQDDLIYQVLLKIVEERDIYLEVSEKFPKELNGLWLTGVKFGEIILLSSSLKGKRRNFTLAHELGHSALHKGTAFNVIANGGKSDPKMEAEADEYAKQLIRDIENKLYREAA